MQVSELAAALRTGREIDLQGPATASVDRVVLHSEEAAPGCLFAALPGARDDGARHAARALELGASAVLHARGAARLLPPRPETVAYLGVEEVRPALGVVAHLLAGRPSERLTVVGITGTNGKTTLTHLVEGMTGAAGLPCGVIGTIECRLGSDVRPARHTTPEAPELQETLRWMADGGARVAVVEVSSHALAQHRVSGTAFRYAVFTNLSQDHLDYHGDMESYYQTKRRLFTEFPLTAGIINLDNEWGRRLAGEAAGEIVTFGSRPEALVRIAEVVSAEDGWRVILEVPGGTLELFTALIGQHNVQNVTAAAALGWRMGIPADAIRRGIAAVREVPGRFQRVSGPGEPLVLVDYAHTPDALEKALESARGLAGGRLVVVFGCGGDRDRGKRPLMGAIAARLSDLAVLTSDNPRSEDPAAIMAAVEEGYRGVREDGLEVIADRRTAIREAIRGAGVGDVVVIAGKGHEDYQILGRETIRFDDREVAREALDSHREAPCD